MAYDRLKRAIDVLVAASLLVALGPLLAVIAFAVWCSGPGPILFRQVRVGRHGAPFRIIKFRSMRQNGRGALITAAGDARVTRVGGVLRRWKLDELPQLINVLRGDMSLVGPRPEVPEYVNMFSSEYREVLSLRPGLTDPATIVFRDEEVILGRSDEPELSYIRDILPQKLMLARSYVRARSLRTDATVLANTVLAIMGWRASKRN